MPLRSHPKLVLECPLSSQKNPEIILCVVGTSQTAERLLTTHSVIRVWGQEFIKLEELAREDLEKSGRGVREPEGLRDLSGGWHRP